MIYLDDMIILLFNIQNRRICLMSLSVNYLKGAYAIEISIRNCNHKLVFNLFVDNLEKLIYLVYCFSNICSV